MSMVGDLLLKLQSPQGYEIHRKKNATATACVRVAYKAVEIMGIPFNFGAGGDPTTNRTSKESKRKAD